MSDMMRSTRGGTDEKGLAGVEGTRVVTAPDQPVTAATTDGRQHEDRRQQ